MTMIERFVHNVNVALVHWPVVDSAGTEVVTNVTNFDIHDIARAARTYGVPRYYIVNRMQEQLMFVSRVVDHWQVGRGKEFNPMRRTALGIVKPAATVEEVKSQFDTPPIVVATAARDLSVAPKITFPQLRTMIQKDPEKPLLLLFGTGFGLHDSLLQQCDYILDPIVGASMDDYRHLSVRSAVSICLDRLLGSW
ncbi:MAG: RNA methyltransferase [Pseudobdellovibrionaceae bacterium]|nr:RNA methyltransferase [Bdellovibrionales bacterium]USN48243.1 MAG: RNA methyltransferase [Pseudobdellovibrionaceae bacterium]